MSEGDRVAALMYEAHTGRLRLDDEVASVCAEACSTLLSELDRVHLELGKDRWAPGFGDFDAGKQLSEKYAAKAGGADLSFRQVIRSHVEAVMQMRELFEAAGRAYREAEDANAARLAFSGESQ